ncbi:MAG: hypothetical protein ACLQVX_15930 [Limisphaerales bacterium]
MKKLGAGNWLKPKQCQARGLASALAGLMTAQSTASARALAARLKGRSGLACAADYIEELAEGSQ